MSPGSYVVAATYRDLVTKQSASLELPFEFERGPSQNYRPRGLRSTATASTCGLHTNWSIGTTRSIS